MSEPGAPFAQQRIYRYCKREGIPINHVGLPKDIKTIFAALKRLKSAEAVATHYGVTRAAVYYRLDKHRKAK